MGDRHAGEQGTPGPGHGQRELLPAGALDARGVRVLSITPEIALKSIRLGLPQGDPAGRLSAATAALHGADLVTIDERLRSRSSVKTLW